MKKYNNQFEELIHATSIENIDEIEDIENIDIPDFDEQFSKFKSKVDKGKGIKKTKHTHVKVAGLVAAMFIGIYVIPTLYQVPSVIAIKKDIDNSIVRISGEIRSIIIKSDNGEHSDDFYTSNGHNKDFLDLENSDEGSTTDLYESIASAQKDINYIISSPFYIPEGYTLDYVEVIDSKNIPIISQSYIKDEDNKIIITQSLVEENSTTVISSQLDSKYEEAYIDDIKVMLLLRDKNSFAVWIKDGFIFEISAIKGLHKEEILKIIKEIKKAQ